MLAVKNGQADAIMYDDAFLVGVAANDRDLKMTTHRFLDVPWGIGIRKGEADMKRWVDAAIRGMRARDMFWKILRNTIPRRFWTTFKSNAPSPKVKPRYPRGNRRPRTTAPPRRHDVCE